MWVEEEGFAVTLGAEPEVVQGEIRADATLRCDLMAFRGLLFMGVSLSDLLAEERIQVCGDRLLVEALLEAWPNSDPHPRSAAP